jgi:hypothetical protein
MARGVLNSNAGTILRKKILLYTLITPIIILMALDAMTIVVAAIATLKILDC